MGSFRTSRRGFTLVELLVVIGIIALLISILLPALGKARQQAQQVVDLSNIRQVAVAILTYSTDNMGRMLPAEVRADAVNPADKPLTLNRIMDTSWTALTKQYKIPSSAYGCNSMANIQDYWSRFGLYQMSYNGPSTVMGWNYLGGRIQNPTTGTPYRTYALQTALTTTMPFNVLRSYNDKQASSQVLLTCINYDANDAGLNFESICPHYHGTGLYIPAGGKWKAMDGLNCAFTDGHAVYVPYSKLVRFQNGPLTLNVQPTYAFLPGPNYQ